MPLVLKIFFSVTNSSSSQNLIVVSKTDVTQHSCLQISHKSNCTYYKRYLCDRSFKKNAPVRNAHLRFLLVLCYLSALSLFFYDVQKRTTFRNSHRVRQVQVLQAHQVLVLLVQALRAQVHLCVQDLCVQDPFVRDVHPFVALLLLRRLLGLSSRVVFSFFLVQTPLPVLFLSS